MKISFETAATQDLEVSFDQPILSEEDILKGLRRESMEYNDLCDKANKILKTHCNRKTHLDVLTLNNAKSVIAMQQCYLLDLKEQLEILQSREGDKLVKKINNVVNRDDKYSKSI